MEPGRTYALPAIEPKLVMPPGLTPASFGLVIDSVSILIEQRDSGNCDCTPTIDTVFIDSTFAWPATQESFRLNVTVPPPPAGRIIEIDLAYRSGGLAMFSGSAVVDFQRGDIRLPPIPMYYYGPGSGADDIQLAPGDTAIAPGDTLDFVATAFVSGVPLDTAYLSWRVSDTSVAKIDHLGHLTLRAGALGSSFLVSAAIPNGVMSSTRVSVPNTVTALLKVAGDSQSAALGERTAAPLVVRARDANNKPVAGARVRFRFLSGAGAALPDSIVFTDLLGLARSAPVPTTAGVSTVQAELSAVPATNTGFTVTGTTALGRPILFAADSGISGFQLYRADSLGGNRATIGYLAGVSVTLTAPRWNPARNRVAFVVWNANASIYQLLLTTANGDTLATLVSDSNSTAPRFSPTGKMIAWVCRGMANGLTLGDICTFNGADGPLGPLNGAANGAGRVEVSATVPGRPTGPPAFAWRPGGSTRIAFVRDTILDSLSGVTASRIYDINGAGGAATALSPKVTDLCRGPLRIQGSIDWSPDGSTIVFSASDTTSYEAALYALDVTTGAGRRLTTPPTGWNGDLYPSFSPDGQRILYRRVNYYYCCGMIQDYFVVRLTGGSPTRITYESSNWGTANLDPYFLGGDWSPNGASVVITAANGLGGRAAYRVPIDVTGQLDYTTRRVLVGTAGIAGLSDYAVSWQP